MGIPPRRPEEVAPMRLELTPEQRQAIIEYVQATGVSPTVALTVDVVEGRIAPAAVAVGAA